MSSRFSWRPGRRWAQLLSLGFVFYVSPHALFAELSEDGVASTVEAPRELSKPSLPSEPEFERFLRHFRDVGPRYPVEDEDHTLRRVYENIEKTLRVVQDPLRRLETIRHALADGRLYVKGHEILAQAEVGVGLALGLEAGLGSYRKDLTWKPHLRIGFSYGIGTVNGEPSGLLGASVRPLALRSWKTDENHLRGASLAYFEEHGSDSKGMFLGVGGHTKDNGSVSELALGAGGMIWDKTFHNGQMGFGLPLLPFGIPSRESRLLAKILKNRARLIDTLLRVDLKSAEAITSTFALDVTRLERMLARDWKSAPAPRALAENDPLASAGNLFDPFYVDRKKAKGLKKILLTPFVVCAKIVGLAR